MIAPLLIALATAAGPDFVEPGDLTRRAELVGRELVVDDRIRYFLESKRGQGFDQFLLKRTDVLFRLPNRLKFARTPSEPNARVLGTLKVEEGHLVFDVSAIEMLPPDSQRLERELAKLRAEDFQSRRTWAFWAERRGKELNDSKLEARGVVLEGEALWLEASRPDANPLTLAARSVGRPIPDLIRNALFHRGYRDGFVRASTPEDLDALAKQIEASLPSAGDPKAPTLADRSWLDAYAKDPASTYKDAPETVRTALDRRLLADVMQRSLEKQLEISPIDSARLAQIASERLPDRPDVADRLRKQALVESETRVTSMRQAEVEELAKKFRDQGEEDRARRLMQSWLADRRKSRLSASDAEGRILLAASYEKMLGDRATSAELLREALGIDPQSKSAVDAFLRMGFRKRDNDWYDPIAAKTQVKAQEAEGASGNPGRPSGDTGDSLKGLTRTQVRSRLGGKPDLIVRSASQGRSVEQWIYKNGKGTQVIRFVFEPSASEPRASAYYSDQK